MLSAGTDNLWFAVGIRELTPVVDRRGNVAQAEPSR
jgi:hypothetical protein